jgi:hypothetical protein
MSAGPVLFVEPGWEPETFSTRTAKGGARATLRSILVFWQKGGREMVKQRFLTHFKPWLIAVCKAGVLIVTYQLFDEIRTWLQRPPLNIFDVVTAATIALFALALLCACWAWGEWCSFKMRRVRGWWSYKIALVTQRNQQRLGTSRP